jgi:hypothetical protein
LPSYHHLGTQNARLNFSKGQWLLANFRSNAPNEADLEATIVTTFQELIGDRLTQQIEAQGLLVPLKIKTKEIENYLKDFKNGQSYDFLIAIEADVIQEVSSIQLGQFIESNSNKTVVIANVYDLNLQTLIYTHKVTCTVTYDEESNYLSFGKSTQKMLDKSLKRLLRSMKKC